MVRLLTAVHADNVARSGTESPPRQVRVSSRHIDLPICSVPLISSVFFHVAGKTYFQLADGRRRSATVRVFF